MAKPKPVPKECDAIVAKVKERWLKTPRHLRPPIEDPSCMVAFLTVSERETLAAHGYYPIPPEVLDPVAWENYLNSRFKLPLRKDKEKRK